MITKKWAKMLKVYGINIFFPLIPLTVLFYTLDLTLTIMDWPLRTLIIFTFMIRFDVFQQVINNTLKVDASHSD